MPGMNADNEFMAITVRGVPRWILRVLTVRASELDISREEYIRRVLHEAADLLEAGHDPVGEVIPR